MTNKEATNCRNDMKNTTFHIQSKEKNKIYFIEKSIVLTGDHT